MATAEDYGFNSPPTLFNDAATEAVDLPSSTIPTDLDDNTVATGESAIGQGEVLATPLEMAAVAQTVANRGMRMPNVDRARAGAAVRRRARSKVTSKETAATLRELMIGVVDTEPGSPRSCRGSRWPARPVPPSSARRPTRRPPHRASSPSRRPTRGSPAFAPAADPKIVVAVMVVNSDGDGGTVAAPIARQVMASYFGVH